MEENKRLPLDYLFEVSWEVCNKVGGIHTVLATKALTVQQQLGDRYIVIGPDLMHDEGGNPEFEEDPNLLKAWRQAVYAEGIRIRVGRWKVKGSPMAVLVDFSNFFAEKDAILSKLWEDYQVDSISGQWDYVEPVLFGHAAARVIAHYAKTFCKRSEKMVAHFHEWMTSSGGLYLRRYNDYIATVFTTHATVMGRSIAGNHLPLYSGLTTFNADDLARQFGVTAKHSLEKKAAEELDCFATVSDLTANECKYLLDHEVDIVTPNGFEDDFVWKGKEFDKKRKEGRRAMITVAEACLGKKYDKEPLIVMTSGRYEYKNKGIDVFVDSLLKLAAREDLDREILAVIAVPAGNNGPRFDLQARLKDPNAPIDPSQLRNTTHYLREPDWDPVVRQIRGTCLENPACKVQLLFVPTYLNGADGIFDKHYYELLVGADVSAFPSYYEPWGYTPLESVAFSVPTITTTLAGFGLWVKEDGGDHPGVKVLERTDTNDNEVSTELAEEMYRYGVMKAAGYNACRTSAAEVSRLALWDHLIAFYGKAYALALENVARRAHRTIFDGGGTDEQVAFLRQQLETNRPNWVRLMVERDLLPERLRPLEELTRNLWWSWQTDAHALFETIDYDRWVANEKNPIAFLDNLPYKRFLELEKDEEFIARLDRVYADFNAYMAEKAHAKGPKIGYFSMEYGLLNSLKIYSGGLGILAGDYLKEASDQNVPMVAVGLLYRYGYFTQKLTSAGAQEAAYEEQNFQKLPISPVRDEEGNWQTVRIAFPGRTLTARIWRCDVGRTELYLLDTDHDMNLPEDRSITHHLYGGDWENRLKQELLLGIGGIRTLRALHKRPDVYHCNEGHAAFIGIERIRNLIDRYELSFSEALEVVRSSSLFTTHTPVPAGHDAFPESMLRQYISHYPEKLDITWDQLINLGKTNPNDPNEKFSMSFLACNLSQEVNGVSWLHGEVSKEILGAMWPGYFKDELHIGYVTNGVHFPTWGARRIRRLYNKVFGEAFARQEYHTADFQKIHGVDDRELWDVRLHLKNKLAREVKKRLCDPSQFRFDSPRQLIRVQEGIRPDILTIGFARRFATYKRAHLLFTNLDRLDRIVNNPERPVQFLFAGKAHPNDKPGQDLIKRIVEVSALPQFAGKIIFLQNYDMALARKMVQGVDIWLNTPTRPLEASGTSGEKAVMNGVMHFSVLDGWWVEGYKEGAGWMLPMENTFEDPYYQNEIDAERIYDTIEDEIAPKYYSRNEDNVPHEWVGVIKHCIADVASNFTTARMLADYQERFYAPLYARAAKVNAGDFRLACEIAAWKRRVSRAWDNVRVLEVRQADLSKTAYKTGDRMVFEVVVDIDGLSPEDIGAEVLFANQITSNRDVKLAATLPFKVASVEGSVVTYRVEDAPEHTGSYDVAIRLYAHNPDLPHRMDFALVKWA